MTPNRSNPLEKQSVGVRHGWTPLLDAMPQGVILVDAGGRYLEVNPASVKILGMDRETLLSLSLPEPWARLSSADGTALAVAGFPGLVALRTGTSVLRKTLGWHREDGSTTWLEMSITPLKGGGVLMNFDDTSAHLVQSRKLDRLTELYSALSQVNQAIVWAPTAEALFGKICEVMVRHGKFNMAWIGWSDLETREVKVLSQFGDRYGYLDGIQVRSDDTPLGRGGTGTAIREGRTCVVNDFLGSPTSSPWHDAAVRSGFAASASIPIRKGGIVCGALVVYAAEKDYFGSQELGLLEEAAGDLTFSLDHHEMEAERKKVNEIIVITNEMLQKILDTISQFICWKDKNSKFLGCNNNYAKMVGLPDTNSIIGKTDWDLPWQKEETENFLKYDRKIMENDSPEYHIIEFALDANGKETCLDTSKVPLHDAAGNVSGILVAFEDITERKAAEQALVKSERFLREAQAAGGVGCFSLDVNLGIWESSETFNAIFGIGPDYPRDISGWLDLVAPDALEAHQQQLQDLIRGEGRFDLEFMIRRKRDGRERWVTGQGSLEYDSCGQTTRLIGTMLDITARKLAEAEILRLNQDLEQRVKLRTAQLEAANKELEAFSYSVSHDLRAPLRSIEGFSQVLLEDYQERLDEDGRHHLSRIQNGSKRMGQIIDDLLRMSRIDRTELKPEVLDFSGLCRMVLDNLRSSAPDRQVNVSVQPGMRVQADPSLMQEVIENLLSNAWKFTSKRQDPRIEVGEVLSPSGEQILFIRDNGAGFDMANAEKLFTAFQRLHAVTDFEGTGIGLTIVQRIIHRHGGRIWAEAEEEKEATFFFTLPGPSQPALLWPLPGSI